MLKKVKIEPFVIAIIISIILAYFFPWLGSKESAVPLDTISSIGISIIFLFYGLTLSTDEIKSGLQNWKLHVVVQACSFILFPLLIIAFFPLLKGTNYQTLWLAFLFLAALPSAVSSSVVMVSIARGNLPGAIFNASISGIIGILITPLWMSSFTVSANIEYDFTSIYSQLITEIVVPLTLGLFLRKYFGKFARKNKKAQDYFDKFIVLLIIYKSFVHSFEDNIFSSLSVMDLFGIFGIVVLLFFTMYNITDRIAKWLKFSHADRITAQYCGTKKSMIHGTVFSEALFGQTNIIGIILLPLMFYHAFQILIVSFFATSTGRYMEAKERKHALEERILKGEYKKE